MFISTFSMSMPSHPASAPTLPRIPEALTPTAAKDHLTSSREKLESLRTFFFRVLIPVMTRAHPAAMDPCAPVDDASEVRGADRARYSPPAGDTDPSVISQRHQDAREEWWLAQKIITHAIETPSMEQQLLDLLEALRRVTQEDGPLTVYAIHLVNQLMDLVSGTLRSPALMNAFDPDKALMTLYYVLRLLLCCALKGRVGGGIDCGALDDITTARHDTAALLDHVLRTYEAEIVRVVQTVNRLLLNRDVYERVEEVFEDAVGVVGAAVGGKVRCSCLPWR